MNIYTLGTGIEAIDYNHNYYLKDVRNYHNAIVGTWKWEDANNSFKITIQEFEMVENAPNGFLNIIDQIV